MIKIIKRFWPVLFLIFFGIAFWGFFLRNNKVLLPADLLVGAYYPWRENKWGYEVAVPYKNPLLSDSYSQLFIWKKLISDSYKRGEIPLWNQYSYSGYPLAANIQSAAFYPLNILFIFLPFNTAWNIYLILGSILSSLTMYWLIRVLKLSPGAGIVGGIAYGYCGYALSWMEFATATNSMIWIPLLVLIIEKYCQNKKAKNWWWLSAAVLMLISSGSFQMCIYGLLVFVSYLIFKKVIDIKAWLSIFIFGILGILISSIVLLPGIEMLNLSIRNLEKSMSGINYGLVPLSHLITLFAPDFFGNPATNNYWGFSNYHETLIYAGAIVFLAIIWSITNFKKLPAQAKYFLFLVGVSLLFYFDNPLSRFGYWLNIPGLNTASAGRNAYFWAVGGSVLVGYFVDNFPKNMFWDKIKIFGYWWLILGATFGISWGVKNYYLQQSGLFLVKDISNFEISIRNLIFPLLLSLAFCFGAMFFSKWKGWWILLIILVGLDSGRFVYKYLPISDAKYVFPSTPSTDFLKKDNDLFRVEKENGALLSPNTWTMYGLSSPSGYDPMASAAYTKKFNEDLNGVNNSANRYAEIDRYDAKMLGKYNVKYLLAIKKDSEDRIPGDKINYKINPNDWEKVSESETVAVLKNKYFQSRARIVNGTGKVVITEYQNNSVKMNYEASGSADLVLMDTWYPGWKAWVNGEEKKIEKYDEVFRKVTLTKGSGVVEMRYEPDSLVWGEWISGIVLGIWLLILFFL